MTEETSYTQEHWITGKWRPALAWVYIAICAFDFIIAPFLWSILQGYDHGAVTEQWRPLTLQGAGLFHISMGTILGISAHGRTQEKLSGAVENGFAFLNPAKAIIEKISETRKKK